MPQMKTSNMLDTMYKAIDINQKNGRYRMEIYRESIQCQAFHSSCTTGQR